MSRFYKISGTTAALSAAADLLRISAASSKVCKVHSVRVEQITNVTSAQLAIKLHRGTTDGSGGSAATITPLSLGDPAFGGTAYCGNTTQSTEGTILDVGGFNNLNGWLYNEGPQGAIEIPPSGRLVVECETAPGAIVYKVSALVEELG
jgi:hypothetical protein